MGLNGQRVAVSPEIVDRKRGGVLASAQALARHVRVIRH
jgi:hypothetical protein